MADDKNVLGYSLRTLLRSEGYSTQEPKNEDALAYLLRLNLRKQKAKLDARARLAVPKSLRAIANMKGNIARGDGPCLSSPERGYFC